MIVQVTSPEGVGICVGLTVDVCEGTGDGIETLLPPPQELNNISMNITGIR